MENGVEYVENTLKPVINHHIDELALRAQNIAFDALIDDKLAALRQAGEGIKSSVTEKVDALMAQASRKGPDQDDPYYTEKVEIYLNWLDEVRNGFHNVRSFFTRIWRKMEELLAKIFTWIRNGVENLSEKISNAFRIVKTTLFR